MSDHRPRLEDVVLTRRELLNRSGMGMGALALGGLMSDAGLLGASAGAGDVSPSGVSGSIRWPPGRRRCGRGPSASSTCS
jgi:hypothetical protein